MSMVATSAPRAQRRAIIFAAALIGIVITCNLGAWQLRRAAQKEALLATLIERSHMPAIPQAALATTAEAAALQAYRPIQLRGHWLAAKTIYLDNRQMNDRQGFIVVTPLQWEGGAVLVQRGWVLRDNDVRTRLPPLISPSGDVEVVGHIAPPPARLYEFSAAASGVIRQNLDPSEYSREIGIELRPLSIVEDRSDGPEGAAASAPGALQRNWPAPTLDVERNYGYAFQWFAMAALMAGLYVWFQLIRPAVDRSRHA